MRDRVSFCFPGEIKENAIVIFSKEVGQSHFGIAGIKKAKITAQ